MQRLLNQGHFLGCCAISVAEIYAGMRNSEKVSTDELIDSLEYFPITREAARVAGQFKKEYAQKGITLSIADVLIATTALAYNLVLLTDNVDHFPMPQLKKSTL